MERICLYPYQCLKQDCQVHLSSFCKRCSKMAVPSSVAELVHIRSSTTPGSRSGSGSRIFYQLKKNSVKTIFLENFKKIMVSKELFCQLSTVRIWMVNLCLTGKSYTDRLYFILLRYLYVWTQNRIGNTDPDPQSFWIRIQYGSGSTHWYFLCGGAGAAFRLAQLK